MGTADHAPKPGKKNSLDFNSKWCCLHPESSLTLLTKFSSKFLLAVSRTQEHPRSGGVYQIRAARIWQAGALARCALPGEGVVRPSHTSSAEQPPALTWRPSIAPPPLGCICGLVAQALWALLFSNDNRAREYLFLTCSATGRDK